MVNDAEGAGRLFWNQANGRNFQEPRVVFMKGARDTPSLQLVCNILINYLRGFLTRSQILSRVSGGQILTASGEPISETGYQVSRKVWVVTREELTEQRGRHLWSEWNSSAIIVGRGALHRIAEREAWHRCRLGGYGRRLRGGGTVRRRVVRGTTGRRADMDRGADGTCPR